MPLLAFVCLAVCTQQTNKDRNFDPKAILNAFFDKIHDAPTAKGVIEGNGAPGGQRIVFRIMRPNLFSMINPTFEVRGDGKSMVMKMKGRKEPIRFKESEGAPFIYGFEAMTTDHRPDYVKAGRLSIGTFKGKPAYVIPIVDDRQDEGGTVRLYIDRESLLPVGCEFEGKGQKRYLAYRDVVLGERMSRAEFVKGAKS